MSNDLVGSTSRTHLTTVARGGAVGLVGAVAAAIAGFVLVITVSRALPLHEAGLFFAVTSLFGLLMAVAQLGTDTGLGRFVLRHRAAGTASDVTATVRAALLPALALSVFIAVLMALAGGPVAEALNLGPEAVLLMRVLAVMLPAAVLAEVCLSATRAHGLMGSTVVIDRFVRAWFQPVAVLILIASGAGLWLITVGWASAYLVSAVVAAVALRRLLVTRGALAERASSRRAHEVFVEFWSFTWLRSVARVAQVGIQKVDIVLVAVLVSPTAAAVYTAATRFVPLGQLGTQALQMALQPQFTAILLSEDRTALQEVYRVSTAWSIVLAWPVYLGVGALAGTYLALFGDAVTSPEATQVVWVMAAAMLFAVASGPVDTLLLMSGRSASSAFNAGLALVVDISLCLLLLPRMGMLGAAIAWAAAIVTRVTLAVIQVHRTVGVDPFDSRVALAALLPIACVGLPLVLLSQVEDRAWVLLLAAASCGLAFLGALYGARHQLALDHFVLALRRRARVPSDGVKTWV